MIFFLEVDVSNPELIIYKYLSGTSSNFRSTLYHICKPYQMNWTESCFGAVAIAV